MTSTQVTPRTVIEAFLPVTGSADLSIVYDTANLVGIDDQRLRLAIRRMIARGEVVQNGRGRSGTIALTEEGADRLRRDHLALRLALAQDSGAVKWDGCWHLIALSAPEGERAVRDTVRRELRALGAASLSTGLYVSPHDLSGMLPQETRGYLVTAKAHELNVRGEARISEVVELLWPEQDTLRAYEKLEEVVRFDPKDETGLVRQLRLAQGFEDAVRGDPLIPPELRAGAWKPSELRLNWLEAWRRAEESIQGPILYSGWIE